MIFAGFEKNLFVEYQNFFPADGGSLPNAPNGAPPAADCCNKSFVVFMNVDCDCLLIFSPKSNYFGKHSETSFFKTILK